MIIFLARKTLCLLKIYITKLFMHPSSNFFLNNAHLLHHWVILFSNFHYAYQYNWIKYINQKHFHVFLEQLLFIFIYYKELPLFIYLYSLIIYLIVINNQSNFSHSCALRYILLLLKKRNQIAHKFYKPYRMFILIQYLQNPWIWQVIFLMLFQKYV